MNTQQIGWLGIMSIDDVSAKLGELTAEAKLQTKLVSKLFDKGEERDKRFMAFEEKFSKHAAEEEVRLQHMEDELVRTAKKVDGTDELVLFGRRRKDQIERRGIFWRDIHKALIKWGLIGVLVFITGWMGKWVLIDLQNIVNGGK